MFHSIASLRRGLASAAAVALCCFSAGMAGAAGERLLVGTDDRILEFDGHTGRYAREFVPSGLGGLSNVQSLTAGPDGSVFASSWNSGQVLRYDGQSGAFLGVFVEAGLGGLSNPDQMAFGPDGNFYVSDRFTGRVIRYHGQTGALIDTFVEDHRLGGFVAFVLRAGRSPLRFGVQLGPERAPV